MIRIGGITLNEKKQIKFALTPIKGVGKNNVIDILAEFYIVSNSYLKDLSEDTLVALRNYIETKYIVEADLRRKEQSDIKRLIDIGTWRGKRHKAGLPVRGQTTKTNSRTRRGNVRKTGGSGKIKAQKT